MEEERMPVVQDTFFIPNDIAIRLSTGSYRRIGSVIRYADGPNKGQIVKHLKPIDLNATGEAQSLGVKALQFAKQHKIGTVIAVASAAAVSTGVWIYNKVKKHEPTVVTEFRAALKVYVEAIRNGNMDIDKINKLMTALEGLKEHKNYEKISLQLTTEELEVLVGRIYEYTIRLAKDNYVELPAKELDTALTKNSSAIMNLQNYLKAQKMIFEAAA